jgi:hypothetical protein
VSFWVRRAIPVFARKCDSNYPLFVSPFAKGDTVGVLAVFADKIW